MKYIPFITTLFLSLLLSCNSNRQVILSKGSENWSEYHAGDTTTLHYEYYQFVEKADTFVHYTNYYQNGALKSKVLYHKEFLMEIEEVRDTLGRKLKFGRLNHGNGYVVQYRNDGLGLDGEGTFENGNRVGWWKNYHFRNANYDSVFYIEGVAQWNLPPNTLDSLIDNLFGEIKNNWYD